MIRINFKKGTTIQNINDEEITFSDGTKLSYFHDQDCCENVYADFKAILDQPIMNMAFDSIFIEGIADFGIVLNVEADGKWSPKIRNQIPCYNQQNGYYSGNLELIVAHDNFSISCDITKYVKDEIY